MLFPNINDDDVVVYISLCLVLAGHWYTFMHSLPVQARFRKSGILINPARASFVTCTYGNLTIQCVK